MSGAHRCDLAVIGAGSAGFSAAITAAERGADVTLIGHGTLGGTCVNAGCVPSKAIIRATEAVHHAKTASRFAGIRGEAEIRDWAALIAQKDALVAGLRKAKYADLLPDYNTIAHLEGEARLAEGGVAVNGELVRAPRVVITTGARPTVPPILGIEEVDWLTSTSLLELDHLPRSLLVLGGGFIGAELAHAWARAGVEVTVVCRSRLLPQVEPEIGDALAGYFRDEGIGLRCGIAYESCRQKEGGVVLRFHDHGALEELRAERVLIATGRAPNVESLGLEQAGVAQVPNGAIVVDERMRTTRPATYAAGDVTGGDQLVYMAAYGAKLAALNALDGDMQVYDDTVVPRVVFTDPQVATVGLSEAEARGRGHAVKTTVLSLEHVPRALAARDTRGLIKLVADADSDRLLGAHVLAPEGADTIQTAVLALRHGMTAKELAETIFPYLTTVEGLKLAAQSFERDVTRLSCCA